MLKRLKIQFEDFVRFHPATRNALAYWTLLKTRGAKASNTAEATQTVEKLCQAARLTTTEAMMRKVEAAIERQLPAINPAEVPWSEYYPDFNDELLWKAIVLKPYVSAREKGVVFISFDTRMAQLAKSKDLKAFAERYTLVLSPQWSPPHSIATYLFPLLYPDDIFCLISNERDMVYFPRISKRYRMIPLYASSWVDARKYTPVERAEKDIDIFMLANFAKYKRHHALFAALRDVPKKYRIVLVGQRDGGRTRETILEEARAFGVEDRFEIRENVSEQELHDTFVRAKTSLILSRREGSCVAVVESMFANTPVAVYEDAEVGSRAFVNAQTGKLLRREGVGAQLAAFVEESAQYEPRKWVMENGVDCIASSAVLNEALKTAALGNGAEWTEDIATLRWRPDPRYYFPEDLERLRPSYEDLEKRCGIVISRVKLGEIAG
jgi:glycosyltransferase involved in cell wall biosynthesis